MLRYPVHSASNNSRGVVPTTYSVNIELVSRFATVMMEISWLFCDCVDGTDNIRSLIRRPKERRWGYSKGFGHFPKNGY